MDMHLQFWFGTVRPEDAEEDVISGTNSPVVCWCGARRVQFSSDVVACYHAVEWPGDAELEEFDKDSNEQ
jgi:hypothetical protein